MSDQAEMHKGLVVRWAVDGLVAKHNHAEDAAYFRVIQNLSQWTGFKVWEEKAKWVAAFTAYQKALSEPYFDQDDESRQSNRAEVQRTFDALKELADAGG